MCEAARERERERGMIERMVLPCSNHREGIFLLLLLNSVSDVAESHLTMNTWGMMNNLGLI